VAAVALAVSLLLHGALLGGLNGLWPTVQAPAPAPVFEARLITPPPPPPPISKPAPKPVPKPVPKPRPVVLPAPVPAPASAEPPAPEVEAPAASPVLAAPETAEAAAEAVSVASAAPADPVPEPTPAPAAEPAPPPLNPLPARIDMRFELRYGPASGEQTLVWVNDGTHYTLTSVAAATGLTGLFYRGRFVQTSRGRITAQGLQPEMFWDQRGDKRASARFDPDSGQGLWEPARGAPRSFAYPAGMQDALSLFFQLALTAPPAGAVSYDVFNGKKLRRYTYVVRGEETLDTALGALRTLHLARADVADERFETWLAIDRHYLPVRIVRSDDDGRVMEMLIRAISP
jgi:hypothetical protein